MSNTSSRIVKNTGFLYIKTLVSMFVMLYVTRVILQSLGAEDFGIFNVIGGTISMLGFVNLSMARTIQRFLNNAQGKSDLELQKSIFNISIAFHFVIGVLIVLFLYAAQFLLFGGVLNISESRQNAAVIVYWCMIISTFLSILAVPYDALINAHEDMFVYSIVGIVDVLLKLLIAIYISMTSYDRLIVYGVLMIIVPVVDFFSMRLYAYKHYPECRIDLIRSYDKSKAREMLKYAGWNFMGISTSMVENYGVGIVLNHFFGAILNAASGIATQMQGMLSVLSAQFLSALNPVIYKLGGLDEKERMLDYSFIGCKYSYLLLVVLAVPVLLETPFFLNLWLSEVPEWSVTFVRLIIVKALLEQLTYSLTKSLEATGTIRQYYSTVSIFNLLPLIVLFIVYKNGGQPYWHIIVPIIFVSFIPSLLKLYYCRKYCSLNVNTFLHVVLVPCLLITVFSLMAGSIPLYMGEEGICRAIVCVVLSWIAVTCFYVITMSTKERSSIIAYYDMLRNKYL